MSCEEPERVRNTQGQRLHLAALRPQNEERAELTSPDRTTSFPRPSVLSRSISIRYSMSVLRVSGAPWNEGPGFVYTVHPSGQCCPVAVGPLSTLHLRRSKLKISWAPRQFCQTTPLVSMATPP